MKSISLEEKGLSAAAAAASTTITKKIGKFSWADEDTKVRILIDTNQFNGEIQEHCVEVNFDE